MSPTNPNACTVSGFLYVMFWLAKITGVAPIRFERHQNTHRIRLSTYTWLHNCVWITLLTILALAALIVDMSAGSERSSRAHTSTRLMVWVTELSASALIVNIAVYCGRRRTKVILKSLLITQKINKKVGKKHNDSSKDMRKIILLACIHAFVLSLTIADYWIFMASTLRNDRDLISAILYVTVYIFSPISYSFISTCAVSSLEVCATLEAFNDFMYDNLECHSFVGSASMIRKQMNKIKLNQVDVIGIKMKYNPDTVSISKAPYEEIREYATTFKEICETVDQLNDTFGLGYLVILVSLLMRLVMTPYNFIVNIRGHVKLSLLSMELLWMAIHIGSLVGLVEPCHRTQEAISRTGLLVGKYLLKTNDEQAHEELLKFSRYLTLNKTSYTPMGLCTYSRRLMASIAGSVATYLVIICQFQGPDTGEF